MKLKFKKLDPNAVAPKYAKPGDAAVDLTAVEVRQEPSGKLVYRTGLAVEIPPGHVGLLFPRSSIGHMDLSLTNAVGVIDSGYRGEIKAIFRPEYDTMAGLARQKPQVYMAGDRIVQMIVLPYPTLEFEEVQELSNTARGDGGFGSTGK